jgi:hypothetical protein
MSAAGVTQNFVTPISLATNALHLSPLTTTVDGNRVVGSSILVVVVVGGGGGGGVSVGGDVCGVVKLEFVEVELVSVV